jgi:hypothetical protein
MVPPFGPVTFHTHDAAAALRGRKQDSANAAIGVRLERRGFNCGVVLLPIIRKTGKYLSLGFGGAVP